jgi:ParB family transcriptional regulator, chromosome partitioning protein
VSTVASTLRDVSPRLIDRNPFNPRLYFNDEQLDLLRTSIQEVGILVPLIVYANPETADERYVLMDGERRWRCAIDLGLPVVPVNVIPAPSRLENLLRMFNIHSVREDWALVSIALSLQEIMKISGEAREARLAEMTGLPRSDVRRAKRLLSLPTPELDRIRQDAHFDRKDQVHREDLYLEIMAAEAAIRKAMPTVAAQHSREEIIRQFARKREEGRLVAITEFREIVRLVRAMNNELVSRQVAERAVRRLIANVKLNPSAVAREAAPEVFEQQGLMRRAELLAGGLASIEPADELPDAFRKALEALEEEIARILRRSR